MDGKKKLWQQCGWEEDGFDMFGSEFKQVEFTWCGENVFGEKMNLFACHCRCLNKGDKSWNKTEGCHEFCFSVHMSSYRVFGTKLFWRCNVFAWTVFHFCFGVEVDVRSFQLRPFFVNTLFYVGGCWSTASLYVMGFGSVALSTDL